MPDNEGLLISSVASTRPNLIGVPHMRTGARPRSGRIQASSAGSNRYGICARCLSSHWPASEWQGRWKIPDRPPANVVLSWRGPFRTPAVPVSGLTGRPASADGLS